MGIAIRVEDLSKAYQLGEIGTGTLSRDIERWFARVRGKEDPFLKIGEVNDRTMAGGSNIVWSLRHIDFEIRQGDAVGIIGRNGAGKSTLLKLLSRVTSPTSGVIKAKGRIASLLEVGTGFHPELTGRENIYLNGAILGMRKKEIDRRFDEIVDFSGVEKYIDTPVKRYSSGMYVRLAFAVAAHLESEILIVDEVLAVGDAEFQKKCLGKMRDVSAGQGRTVLFVSHNMGMINQLCDFAFLIENGELLDRGETDRILNKYISRQRTLTAEIDLTDLYINELFLCDTTNSNKNEFLTSEELMIRMGLNATKINFPVTAGIAVLDTNEAKVFTTISNIENSRDGIYCTIPSKTLTPGNYSLDVALFNSSMHTLTYINNVIPFKIIDGGTEFSPFEGKNYGRVFVDCKWSST